MEYQIPYSYRTLTKFEIGQQLKKSINQIKKNQVSLEKKNMELIVEIEKKDKMLEGYESQIQDLKSVVEKVKTALGIPEVVPIDSEIKQGIKTEALDYETT